MHSVPAPERWAGLGTKEELIAPGCFDAHRQALLASDPKSGELGGAVRIPAGRSVDEALAEPYFDAAKISVPTLVIRGDADTWATREDNQQLIDALGQHGQRICGDPEWRAFSAVREREYAVLRGAPELSGS